MFSIHSMDISMIVVGQLEGLPREQCAPLQAQGKTAKPEDARKALLDNRFQLLTALGPLRYDRTEQVRRAAAATLSTLLPMIGQSGPGLQEYSLHQKTG